MSNKKIQFEHFDWKADPNEVLERIIEIGNGKKNYYRMIETDSDEYCLAHSETQFTKKEAETHYEKWINEER